MSGITKIDIQMADQQVPDRMTPEEVNAFHSILYESAVGCAKFPDFKEAVERMIEFAKRINIIQDVDEKALRDEFDSYDS